MGHKEWEEKLMWQTELNSQPGTCTGRQETGTEVQAVWVASRVKLWKASTRAEARESVKGGWRGQKECQMYCIGGGVRHTSSPKQDAPLTLPLENHSHLLSSSASRENVSMLNPHPQCMGLFQTQDKVVPDRHEALKSHDPMSYRTQSNNQPKCNLN